MDREHVKYVKAVGDLAQDSGASAGRAASPEPRAKSQEKDQARAHSDGGKTEQHELAGQAVEMVRIAKYGPGSEKLSDPQLELLELEPGVSTVEVQAESERSDGNAEVMSSISGYNS
jgi:hypothetical protein